MSRQSEKILIMQKNSKMRMWKSIYYMTFVSLNRMLKTQKNSRKTRLFSVINLIDKYTQRVKRLHLIYVHIRFTTDSYIKFSLLKLIIRNTNRMKTKLSMFRRIKDWGIKIWLVISLLMGIATLTSKSFIVKYVFF